MAEHRPRLRRALDEFDVTGPVVWEDADAVAGGMDKVEVSVVVETYMHSEGSELERLRAVVAAADEMVSAHGRGEVLVADYGEQPDVTALLRGLSPRAAR